MVEWSEDLGGVVVVAIHHRRESGRVPAICRISLHVHTTSHALLRLCTRIDRRRGGGVCTNLDNATKEAIDAANHHDKCGCHEHTGLGDEGGHDVAVVLCM